jgi:putative membrane fusion protein
VSDLNDNTKRTLKIIASVAVCIFVIVYIGYQVYMMNRVTVKTETAVDKTVYETVDTTAFFVRDESYIQNSASGTLVPLVTDGMRVANGDTVAVVFKDEQSARDYSRIAEINQTLNYYKSLKNRIGVQTTDLTSVEKRIDKACESYISMAQNGDISQISSYRDALKEAITARQLSTGSIISVDDKIAALESELGSLSKASGGYVSVTVNNPGYYISTTDGYENSVDYKDAVNYGVEQIDALITSSPSEDKGVMGKLVDSFNWYVLCNIDSTKITSFKTDSKVKIILPNSSVQQLEAYFIKINDSKGGKTAIVLRGNEMNESIANLRLEKAQLVINEYTGFRIDNKAIREVDGQQGVYVLVGNLVRFRKINTVYSQSDFSIVTGIDGESGYLRRYDEVIVEGTDLYDGKVIS